MAQVITTGFGADPPSLEELLVTALQVGEQKPRGEIEIDYVIPGFTEIGSTQDLNLAYGTLYRDMARYATSNPGGGAYGERWNDLPNANDGSDSTKCVIGNGLYAFNDYLASDLGAAHECTAFVIYQTNGSLQGYQYSLDGATWVDLTGTWSGNATVPAGATFTFTAPITARYWFLKSQAFWSHGSTELPRWEIRGVTTEEHPATNGTATYQV